ncbi:MAG: ComEC/Rec2 family competence protein, partial [Spirochaetales bacterium]
MRFPSLLALSFICTYTVGVLAPSYAYLALGVLVIGFIVFAVMYLFLKRKNKKKLSSPYLLLAMGMGIGWGAVLAIKKISFDLKNHWGMEQDNITLLEGTMRQDAFRRGGVTLLPFEVQVVQDRKGNRHSAYFPLMIASKTPIRFLKGDKVRIQGSFDPSSPSNYFKEKSLIILHRPYQNRIRHYFLKKAMPEQSEGPIALRDALLFGNKDGLSSNLVLAFQGSGTSHILALSGMHVGILVLLFNCLLKPLLGKKKRGLLIFFALIFYIFIVGPMPSLVRAVIMYGVYSATILLERKVNPLDIFSLTFLCASTLFPSAIFSSSNILSYTAVWG